jgi:hypothetical protein
MTEILVDSVVGKDKRPDVQGTHDMANSRWQTVLLSALLAGSAYANVAPPEDLGSTRVAATPAEFRVDEQGAATWSMPIYAVPGTAGVAPNLSLGYSSNGGFGPVGKGFAIQGWSQITRCRASRESGDFRDASGTPIDGEPKAVNFDTASPDLAADPPAATTASTRSAAPPVPSCSAPKFAKSRLAGARRSARPSGATTTCWAGC